MFSKVLDRLFLCQSACEKTFTFFMDPIHAMKFTEILRAECEEKILAYGGAPVCERRMLGFAPAFRQLEYTDFPIERINVRFIQKFGGKLSHRDFLGSLTGLGIARERVGDISVDAGKAAVFADRAVSGFICANLEYVGHVKVSAEIERAENDFWESWPELKADDGQEIIINTGSPRLDAVISGAFRVSRSVGAKLIDSGKVYVNWTSVTRHEMSVHDGDTITVRGYGRLRVETIEYIAKKGRYAVRAYKYS